MNESNIFYAIVTYKNVAWSDMPDIYTYYRNKKKALKDMLELHNLACQEAREDYLLTGFPGRGKKYEPESKSYIEELNFND